MISLTYCNPWWAYLTSKHKMARSEKVTKNINYSSKNVSEFYLVKNFMKINVVLGYCSVKKVRASVCILRILQYVLGS
jgi:hypothetical protein